LTAREADVLALLARGYTNREIAATLVISVKTASVHVLHILAKLDAPNRREAAASAHRLAPPQLPTGDDGLSALRPSVIVFHDSATADQRHESRRVAEQSCAGGPARLTALTRSSRA
jgi:DNA-binding CsgD family transcriptional regulator